MDVSSCEEEQAKKRKIKRKVPPRTALLPIDVPQVAKTEPEDANVSIEPEIKDFIELRRCQPYLQDDEKTGLPVCTLSRQEAPHTKRKRRKVNPECDTTVPLPEGSTILSRAIQHKTQSQHYASYVMEEILARLAYPPYARVDIHDRIIARSALVQSLRETRGRSLPVLDIATANELLQEAGEFTHSATHHKKKHVFPPCKHHVETRSCVGTRLDFRGFAEGGKPEGVPFMSFMYREELITFLATEKSPPSRPCLACMRHDQGSFIFSLACVRRERIKDPSAPLLDSFVVNPSTMWQWYRDIKDDVGGYHGAYMAVASETEWQGFVDAFVLLCFSDIRAVKDQENGRWYLDQSSLIYTSPNDSREVEGPHMGQSLGNF